MGTKVPAADPNSGRSSMNGDRPADVTLGGTPVTLMDSQMAVSAILRRATSAEQRPLGVASVNLDHVHHFGTGGRWHEALSEHDGIEWLNLVDGAPVKSMARRRTGTDWPRLAGSDLIGPLLAAAERDGHRVGFLGGSAETHRQLKLIMSRSRPNLEVAGYWSPDRHLLADSEASEQLATEIASRRVDLLVVSLGKPRQELWIARHGARTGAKVLLAFGAVVDFLAGRVRRSPEWISSHGMEWAWRLAIEPRRLARRYLVDGPGAYLALQRPEPRSSTVPDRAGTYGPLPIPRPSPDRIFAGPGVHADVCVIAVTYNSLEFIASFLESLRAGTAQLTLRVVVADNDSTDGTLEALERHPGVVTVRTGGNLGYSGGINKAMDHAGSSSSILILNPDLRVSPGAISGMYKALGRSKVSAVVPKILDFDGKIHPSLRHEPSLLGIYGDALLGSRASSRPARMSETDFNSESYDHSHFVDWATGAALMMRPETASVVGQWDESYFLYSEEIDYCRRIRESGGKVWYEGSASVWHRHGGSGTSDELTALMAVNRIRYVRKYHTRPYALAFRGGVILGELLRSYQPGHRLALKHVLRESMWDTLPGPVVNDVPPDVAAVQAGAIIIPAHNEANVIGRCLTALAPIAASGVVEVIVACNGCTDNTADVARGFSGVTVLEIPQASKVAALNAGDTAATLWPRIYLDADLELSPRDVAAVLKTLDFGHYLACRPRASHDSSGASRAVRSYYRARGRLPSLQNALWGGGVFGMTEGGRSRFGQWPNVTADDLFVHRAFSSTEWTVADQALVRPRTPQDSRSLLKVLRRHHRGSVALEPGSGTFRQTLADLVRSIRGPGSAFDAAVYVFFAALSRVQSQSFRTTANWERDESTRGGN